MATRFVLKSKVNLQQSAYILKFILFALLISSCTGFSDITIGDVKKVEVKGFEENSFIVAVKLTIDNPSGHKIKVADINSKVFINNQYIGKIVSSDEIIIPAKTNTDYTIQLKVRLTNILGTAFAMMQLSDGNKVKVRLEGELTARSMLMKKKIQINESREITI
jgi:LEA14-like dessication related protein